MTKAALINTTLSKSIKNLLLHEFHVAKPTFIKDCPHRIVASENTLAGLFEMMLRDCIEIATETDDSEIITKKINCRVNEYILMDKSHIRNSLMSENVLCNIIYSTTYKELHDLLKMRRTRR